MGVLLVNLGTPDSTSVADVRKYLTQFFADPKVVELPRLLEQRLGLDTTGIMTSFQSRFGKIKWLQPYTSAPTVKIC